MLRKIIFILSVLLSSIICAATDLDFKTWDIYLPHLKREHLSGWWKLKLLPDSLKKIGIDNGTEGEYLTPDFNDSEWEKAMVPGNWHVPFMMDRKKVERNRARFVGVGWYRLTFKAPEAKPEERAILHFDEIVHKADIFLNGKKVGSHTNQRVGQENTTREDFELDVSDVIHFGKKNTLAIRVYHNGKQFRWGVPSRGGITRRVYLDIRPPTWCKEILITPDENLQGVSIDCIIGGASKVLPDSGWRAEVFEWESGKVVAESEFGSTFEKDGDIQTSCKIAITDAKRWSCESPFLYGVKIKNAQGETSGVKRFGMRTFQVANGTFYLNGKPTMLRGLLLNEHDFTWFICFVFAHNEGDALRRYFMMLRDANINHIRFHTSLMTPVSYDILDELGFLITDELNYPLRDMTNEKIPVKIRDQNINFVAEKDGTLKTEFIERIKRRIYFVYSHPCIATFSFGNEMREDRKYGNNMLNNMLNNMFNNMYDLYSKLDKQNRPLTPSSGRFWKDGSNLERLSKTAKLDYIDTHDYTGSINNLAVGYCQPVAENFINIAQKYYPKGIPPIINGETVYFAGHYFPQFYDGIWESENAAEPVWTKYLWALTEMGKKYLNNKWLSYYWVRNWGTKNYKYRRSAGRGIYTEKILDVQRKLWPDWDGFENLSGEYFSGPEPKYPLSKAQFTPNEAYDSLRQVCAPAVVVLDYVAPNRYSLETITTNCSLINNSENDLDDAKVEITIKKDGKTLSVRDFPVGKVAVGGKKIIPVKINMPDGEGEYVLNYKLSDKSKKLCDRNLNLHLRTKGNVFKPIKTNKKIYLYDCVEKVFTGMGRANTTKLLKSFEVPFKLIDGFDNLNNCDLLIIGANSFDPDLVKNADKIRKYLEMGGKVLVFDQIYAGRIPFIKELEYVTVGAGQFAEIVRGNHSVMKNMSQKEFFCWNQKDWAVYRSFISPLSECAIIAGGDMTMWGADNFGMVVAHFKLGKGTVLLSQAEITPIFEKDSGAGYLARNLILTALADSAVKDARDFKGNELKLESLAREKAHFISLAPAANMAFADKKAGDGKGGWSDQGPRNDLKDLPLGVNTFGGIPFNIADPSRNNDKACIVVSGNPDLQFGATSKPIIVNKKLKRIVFFHTGAWMDKPNLLVGKYIIHYDSGKAIEIPLVTGKEIADWWNAPGNKISNGECAWSSQSGNSVIGVFAYSWTNPHPEEEIKSIIVKSSGKSVLGVMGITGEKMIKK